MQFYLILPPKAVGTSCSPSKHLQWPLSKYNFGGRGCPAAPVLRGGQARRFCGICAVVPLAGNWIHVEGHSRVQQTLVLAQAPIYQLNFNVILPDQDQKAPFAQSASVHKALKRSILCVYWMIIVWTGFMCCSWVYSGEGGRGSHVLSPMLRVPHLCFHFALLYTATLGKRLLHTHIPSVHTYC